ncbi:MAG: hypothetical protein O7H41_20815 [Planctomycetota bacterium]|nr:hypothetical protein [Planctomycetota bacterium]
MNPSKMEGRLDTIEEDLGRLVHLLPNEEVLAAYVRLRPDLDPLTVANLFWPIVERGMESRGIEVSIEGIREYLAEIVGDSRRHTSQHPDLDAHRARAAGYRIG